ncbi:MAG: CPBP family glutamic-type intramembrane protease [Steroidobacteraceae bacterium]
MRAADFESVSPSSVGAGALLVSSAVFGVCQTSSWLAGVFAGAVFGLVYMRTGRLGEAVAAHVTANALRTAAALAGFSPLLM